MRTVAAIVTLALLAGCSSVRDVRLLVRDGGAPAPGVRVRAASLNSGTVPLPLTDATLDEILSAGSVRATATTGEDGRARLRVRRRVPYLIELIPPPLGVGAPAPGEAVTPSRFVLARGGSVEPEDGAARYTLEVVR